MISTLTESAPSHVRAITRAAATQASRPEAAMNQSTAEFITKLAGRFFPVIETPQDRPETRHLHHCQLGRRVVEKVTIMDYNTGIESEESVTFFVLIAWGATWADAVAMWNGRAK